MKYLAWPAVKRAVIKKSLCHVLCHILSLSSRISLLELIIWLRSILSHFQIQIRMKKKQVELFTLQTGMFVLPSFVLVKQAGCIKRAGWNFCQFKRAGFFLLLEDIFV